MTGGGGNNSDIISYEDNGQNDFNLLFIVIVTLSLNIQNVEICHHSNQRMVAFLTLWTDTKFRISMTGTRMDIHVQIMEKNKVTNGGKL